MLGLDDARLIELPARRDERGALVAVDAPPVSYLMNLGVAGDLDIDPDQVRGVLAAVAPIVGTARVAAATGRIVEALAVALEVAELEDDEA